MEVIDCCIHGPEKHININEDVPETEFHVLPAVPGRRAPVHAVFRWVWSDLFHYPGSGANPLMCQSFMCLFGALGIWDSLRVSSRAPP